MGTKTLNIRRAGEDDAAIVASIHDASWMNAYRGVIPARALSRMVQRRGEAWWRRAIERYSVILLLELNGVTAGYATIGRNRVGAFPHQGEVYELYLLPEYQGIGVGSHLFLAAIAELKRRHLKGTLVWVLEDNAPAVRFYHNAGGKLVAEGRETFDGKDLKKLCFAWD